MSDIRPITGDWQSSEDLGESTYWAVYALALLAGGALGVLVWSVVHHAGQAF